jgi:hypothetical protein
LSDNDKLISLREKSSAILSLLTVVASRPADAVEIHKDVTLCGLLPDFNEKHDKKEVDTFYEFLKSEFLTRDNKFSHINHLGVTPTFVQSAANQASTKDSMGSRVSISNSRCGTNSCNITQWVYSIIWRHHV